MPNQHHAFAALVVNWISCGMAVISGLCWIMAARIGAPVRAFSAKGQPLFDPTDVTAASRRQSRWNGIAAWFAALAAFGQGLSLFIANCLL